MASGSLQGHVASRDTLAGASLQMHINFHPASSQRVGVLRPELLRAEAAASPVLKGEAVLADLARRA